MFKLNEKCVESYSSYLESPADSIAGIDNQEALKCLWYQFETALRAANDMTENDVVTVYMVVKSMLLHSLSNLSKHRLIEREVL